MADDFRKLLAKVSLDTGDFQGNVKKLKAILDDLYQQEKKKAADQKRSLDDHVANVKKSAQSLKAVADQEQTATKKQIESLQQSKQSYGQILEASIKLHAQTELETLSEGTVLKKREEIVAMTEVEMERVARLRNPLSDQLRILSQITAERQKQLALIEKQQTIQARRVPIYGPTHQQLGVTSPQIVQTEAQEAQLALRLRMNQAEVISNAEVLKEREQIVALADRDLNVLRQKEALTDVEKAQQLTLLNVREQTVRAIQQQQAAEQRTEEIEQRRLETAQRLQDTIAAKAAREAARMAPPVLAPSEAAADTLRLRMNQATAMSDADILAERRRIVALTDADIAGLTKIGTLNNEQRSQLANILTLREQQTRAIQAQVEGERRETEAEARALEIEEKRKLAAAARAARQVVPPEIQQIARLHAQLAQLDVKETKEAEQIHKQILAILDRQIDALTTKVVLDKADTAAVERLAAARRSEAAAAAGGKRQGEEGFFQGFIGKFQRGIVGGLGFRELAGGVFTGVITAEILGHAIGEVTHSMVELISNSGKLEHLTETFQRLGAIKGTDTQKFLEDLRGATHDMVGDIELLRLANAAWQSDMRVTNSQIIQLTHDTVALARAQGHSTDEAMSALQRAFIGRGRAVGAGAFAQLGRITGIQPAELMLQRYGTVLPQIIQRQEAFNHLLDVMHEKMLRVGEPTITITDRLKILEVEWERTREAFAISLVKTEGFRDFLGLIDQMIVGLRKGEEAGTEWGQKVGKAFGVAGPSLQVTWQIMKDLLGTFEALGVAFGTAASFVTKLTSALLGVDKAGDDTRVMFSSFGNIVISFVEGTAVMVSGVELLAQALELVIVELYRFFELGTGQITTWQGLKDWFKSVAGEVTDFRKKLQTGDTALLDSVGKMEEARAKLNAPAKPTPGVKPPPGPGGEQPLPEDPAYLIKMAKLQLQLKEALDKEELQSTKEKLQAEKDANEEAYASLKETFAQYIAAKKKLRQEELEATLAEAKADRDAKIKEINLEEQLAGIEIHKQQAQGGGKAGETPEEEMASRERQRDLQNELVLTNQSYEIRKKIVEAQYQGIVARTTAAAGREQQQLDDQLIKDAEAAARTRAQAVLKINQDALEEEKLTLEDNFKEGLVSADDYIAKRKAQINQELQYTLNELDDRYNHTAVTLENIAKKEEDVAAARAKTDKELVRLQLDDDSIRIKSLEQGYDRVSKLLETQAKLAATPRGRALVGESEETAILREIALNDRKIQQAEIIAASLNKQSKEYADILEYISQAEEKQERYNEELAKARDLLTPMGNLLDKIAGALGGFKGRGIQSVVEGLQAGSRTFQAVGEFSTTIKGQYGINANPFQVLGQQGREAFAALKGQSESASSNLHGFAGVLQQATTVVGNFARALSGRPMLGEPQGPAAFLPRLAPPEAAPALAGAPPAALGAVAPILPPVIPEVAEALPFTSRIGGIVPTAVAAVAPSAPQREAPPAGIFNPLTGAVNNLVGAFKVLQSAVTGVTHALQSKPPSAPAGGPTVAAAGKLPAFQTGGHVTSTGAAIVDEGEYVLTKGEVPVWLRLRDLLSGRRLSPKEKVELSTLLGYEERKAPHYGPTELTPLGQMPAYAAEPPEPRAKPKSQTSGVALTPDVEPRSSKPLPEDLRHFQEGGEVTETGPAIVHKGEHVLTVDETSLWQRLKTRFQDFQTMPAAEYDKKYAASDQHAQDVVSGALSKTIPFEAEATTLNAELNKTKIGKQLTGFVHEQLAHPEQLAMGGEFGALGAVESEGTGAIAKVLYHLTSQSKLTAIAKKGLFGREEGTIPNVYEESKPSPVYSFTDLKDLGPLKENLLDQGDIPKSQARNLVVVHYKPEKGAVVGDDAEFSEVLDQDAIDGRPWAGRVVVHEGDVGPKQIIGYQKVNRDGSLGPLQKVKWGKDTPSFQTGGYVDKTEPAFLHAGESVLPAGQIIPTTALPHYQFGTTSVPQKGPAILDAGESVLPTGVLGQLSRVVNQLISAFRTLQVSVLGTARTMGGRQGQPSPDAFKPLQTPIQQIGLSLKNLIHPPQPLPQPKGGIYGNDILVPGNINPRTGLPIPMPAGGPSGTATSQPSSVLSQLDDAVKNLVSAFKDLGNSLAAFKSSLTGTPGTQQLPGQTSLLGAPLAPTAGGAGIGDLPFTSQGVANAESAFSGGEALMGGGGGGEAASAAAGGGFLSNLMQGVNTFVGALSGQGPAEGVGAVQQFVKSLGGAIGAIGGFLQSTLGATSTTSGIIGGGLSGASLGGQVGGPIGAAIGAAAGAIIGGISGHKNEEALKLINALSTQFNQIVQKLNDGILGLNQAITQGEQTAARIASAGTGKKGAGKQAKQQALQQAEQTLQSLQEKQHQVLQQLQQQLDSLRVPTGYQEWLSSVEQILTQYKSFAEAAQNTQQLAEAQEYLTRALQQYATTQATQVQSSEISAIQNGIQLNNLYLQRQQLMEQFGQQEQQIMSGGVQVREETASATKAAQLQQLQTQFSQQMDQLNMQITVSQYQYETQQKIFGLATTRVGLETQLITLQDAQTDQQNASNAALLNIINLIRSTPASQLATTPQLLAALGLPYAGPTAGQVGPQVGPLGSVGTPAQFLQILQSSGEGKKFEKEALGTTSLTTLTPAQEQQVIQFIETWSTKNVPGQSVIDLYGQLQSILTGAPAKQFNPLYPVPPLYPAQGSSPNVPWDYTGGFVNPAQPGTSTNPITGAPATPTTQYPVPPMYPTGGGSPPPWVYGGGVATPTTPTGGGAPASYAMPAVRFQPTLQTPQNAGNSNPIYYLSDSAGQLLTPVYNTPTTFSTTGGPSADVRIFRPQPQPGGGGPPAGPISFPTPPFPSGILPPGVNEIPFLYSGNPNDIRNAADYGFQPGGTLPQGSAVPSPVGAGAAPPLPGSLSLYATGPNGNPVYIDPSGMLYDATGQAVGQAASGTFTVTGQTPAGYYTPPSFTFPTNQIPSGASTTGLGSQSGATTTWQDLLQYPTLGLQASTQLPGQGGSNAGLVNGNYILPTGSGPSSGPAGPVIFDPGSLSPGYLGNLTGTGGPPPPPVIGPAPPVNPTLPPNSPWIDHVPPAPPVIGGGGTPTSPVANFPLAMGGIPAGQTAATFGVIASGTAPIQTGIASELIMAPRSTDFGGGFTGVTQQGGWRLLGPLNMIVPGPAQSWVTQNIANSQSPGWTVNTTPISYQQQQQNFEARYGVGPTGIPTPTAPAAPKTFINMPGGQLPPTVGGDTIQTGWMPPTLPGTFINMPGGGLPPSNLTGGNVGPTPVVKQLPLSAAIAIRGASYAIVDSNGQLMPGQPNTVSFFANSTPVYMISVGGATPIPVYDPFQYYKQNPSQLPQPTPIAAPIAGGGMSSPTGGLSMVPTPASASAGGRFTIPQSSVATAATNQAQTMLNAAKVSAEQQTSSIASTRIGMETKLLQMKQQQNQNDMEVLNAYQKVMSAISSGNFQGFGNAMNTLSRNRTGPGAPHIEDSLYNLYSERGRYGEGAFAGEYP